MSRKRFSERQVIETLMRQAVSQCRQIPICYRCRQPFLPDEKVEREHVTELSLGGADDPTNCVYSHKACHAIVTNGMKHLRVGSSKHKKAKVDRILGLTGNGPKKKIASRGFDKTLTRKMNGKVERRT